MTESKVSQLTKALSSVQEAKVRSLLVCEAKQNMLLAGLMGKASDAEIERLRAEVIDAMTASVDAGIDAFKRAMIIMEK